MASVSRGKRASAKRILFGWSVLTTATFAAIAFAGLRDYELDALIAVHGTVTGFASLSVLVLFGLDGLAHQIIPSWKGGANGA